MNVVVGLSSLELVGQVRYKAQRVLTDRDERIERLKKLDHGDVDVLSDDSVNKKGAKAMKYDEKLIEDAVLALLAAFSSEHGNTWKGFDFGVMNRLHEHGFIENPVGKQKSVWLTAEGLERGREIADQLFTVKKLAQNEGLSD